MKKFFNTSNPDTLLKLLLGVWWIVNIFQAGFTELADDEAYYWMFAQNPDWGYYDHPPMVAWLAWLGNWIGGALGVRFFFTILQPVYLYIIWTIIRPLKPTTGDASLFFLISAAIPMLQLYGFIAVPDGPLMLFSALFLLAFKRFSEKDTWANTVFMGVAMAGLAYSKYQGLLVVVFAVFSNPRLLKNYKLYISGILTLVLFLPHLLWQYHHDWVSFRYHLVGRNVAFRWSFITEYLMNLVLVFNPLYFPLYISGWKKGRPDTPVPVRRAMYVMVAGFTIFFGLSALRGHVQPQWLIPICFGLIMILFDYSRSNAKVCRYVRGAGWGTIAFIIAVRLVMIFNPFGIRFEIFNNKTSNAAIAQATEGLPVVFRGSYSKASKYAFYTGNDSFAQPHINYRTSQWEYWGQDDDFIGRRIALETYPAIADSTIKLANGREFSWRIVDDFRTSRRVDIKPLSGPIPETVLHGEKLNMHLLFSNPYDYDIVVSPGAYKLQMAWGRVNGNYMFFDLNDADFTLPAGGTAELSIEFVIPESLPLMNNYTAGFTLTDGIMSTWFNGPSYKVNLLKNR